MKRRCWLWVLLLVAPLAQSGEVAGLYQVELPVADQGEAARREAIDLALAEILVRMTGQREVVDLEAVAPLRKRAASFVQSYHYRTPDPLPVAPAGSGDTPAVTDLPPAPVFQLLHIRFNEDSLTKAVQQAGLPVWGKTRPSVLVLLAVETTDGRLLVDVNASSPWYQALKAAAIRRGIPLMIPLMDLEDRAQINLTDVWAEFYDALEITVERYRPDALLVGKVYPVMDGQWRGHWALRHAGNSKHWIADASDGSLAIAAGLDGVADTLALHYAQVYDESSRDFLRLRITGVHDLQGYARTLKYLQSLELVTRTRVLQVEPDTLVLQLDIHGGRDGLRGLIALGNVLRADSPDGMEQTGLEGELEYRLQP